MLTDVLIVFILIAAANSAPVLLRNMLGGIANWPLDGGLSFFDGRPLLGRSKTWRGLAGAVVCCAAGGWLAYNNAVFGAKLGLAAMAGDLGSSFAKRRAGVASSGRAVGLDQIPESLLPALTAWWEGRVSLMAALGITVAFVALELAVSPVLYRLGFRNKPY